MCDSVAVISISISKNCPGVFMDALSRLLMLNDPQGSIDQNCLLSRDWQLPHAAGELSVIRWHTVTQGFAQLDMPDGTSSTLRPGTIVILPQNSAHRLCQTGEEQTHIVCGSLRLQASSRYFLTALPEVLLLAPGENSPVSHWLKAMRPCHWCLFRATAKPRAPSTC